MLGKVKISKADRYFSLYIRARDNWTCQRCGKYNPPTEMGGASYLQCSHYFGRTRKSVRWDEENCDTLCHGCHRFWEKEDREAYREFKLEQLGEQGLHKLTMRANIPQKVDEKMIEIFYGAKLKEMGVKI